MGVELAVGSVVAGVFSGTTFTAAAGLTIGFSFAAAGTALALGALQTAFNPNKKASFANLAGNFSARAQGLTQNVRQSIVVRRSLYGEARVGGSLAFIETTQNNKFLHLVVALVDHEIKEIGEVWFDDISIPEDAIDSAGNVISGPFANKARIKKHLGAVDQIADADLVAETSVDENFRGREVAYIYARLEYDSDVYPTSIPTISAWCKGKKLFDVRDDTVKYTPNPASIINDYLTTPLDDFFTGLGVSQDDIDESTLIEGLNVCEEYVATNIVSDTIINADSNSNIITLEGLNNRLQYQTADKVQFIGLSLPGGIIAGVDYYVMPYQRKDNVRIKLAQSMEDALEGVAINITSDGIGQIDKIAEPRYFAGGVLETDREPRDNIEDILSAKAGSLVYLGGKWRILAGFYRTPTLTFDENQLTSNIVVRSKVSRKDRFNVVKGVYVTPTNDGEAADYPPVSNSFYVEADNGQRIPNDLDLPMTQRSQTARRLAKIKLEKHRQEIFFDASYNLHAIQTQPGDVILINNTRMGWENKPFEVIKWSLENKPINDSVLFFVNMSLQETAPTVYDWNMGEEVRVDPAPDTNLPSAFDVSSPGTPAISESLFFTRSGAGVKPLATVECIPSVDPFVVSYQFRYKKLSESEFITLSPLTEPKQEIFDIEPDIYTFEARAINEIGVKSDWVSTNFEITGLLAPPSAMEDLSIQAVSSMALLRWKQATDLDVLEGGRVVFRHSPDTSGATWGSSTSIGDSVPGRSTETLLPLKQGSYLVRFYDSSDIPGPVSIVTTNGATALTFTNITSIPEHPLFLGNKTNVVVDNGRLKLVGSGLFDDIPLIDDISSIDGFGGIVASGTYDFATGIDLGKVAKVQLKSHIKALIVNELDLIDDRTEHIDSWADFDGTDTSSADCTVWVRETDDDPNGTPVWSDWQRLDVGEYEARAFQFQARLTSNDPAYNIYVSELV